eukprot:1869032-Heterocapsa_arctica.AAC.1
MYRGQRRIAWRSTTSRAMYTDKAVVVGCGLAMHALGMVSLDPMDEFARTAPPALLSLKLYVDDFLTGY